MGVATCRISATSLGRSNEISACSIGFHLLSQHLTYHHRMVEGKCKMGVVEGVVRSSGCSVVGGEWWGFRCKKLRAHLATRGADMNLNIPLHPQLGPTARTHSSDPQLFTHSLHFHFQTRSEAYSFVYCAKHNNEFYL